MARVPDASVNKMCALFTRGGGDLESQSEIPFFTTFGISLKTASSPLSPI